MRSSESRFRELDTIELWSARLDFCVSYDSFVDTVTRFTNTDGNLYSGFIETDGKNVTSFTRTRYPRAKYGVVAIKDCVESTNLLAQELRAKLSVEGASFIVRSVIGLLEGYNSIATVHTLDEVLTFLPPADVTPATVFSVRPGASVYTEPAAVVRTTPSSVSQIYELAESLRQERFTIEDFTDMRSRVIETKYCTQPD